MAEQPEMGIKITAKDETKEGLKEAIAGIEAFQDAAEDAGEAFQESAEGIRDSTEGVGDALDDTREKAIDHGKQIQEATKLYKLSNIEAMQYRQLLEQTSQTFIKWGNSLQGSNNIATKSLVEFRDRIDRATGGMITYLGAGVQLIGMGLEMYAQISRMVLMWGMHTAATAADTTATVAQTAATGALIPVQASLNAVMMANPAILVAAAIIGVITAIGLAVSAWQDYEDQQEAVDRKHRQMIDNLDQLKTRLRALYEGETADTRDLMSQKEDLIEQHERLKIAIQAATDLGYTERAAQYRDQQNAVYEQICLVDREIELSKGQRSNLQEVLATQNAMTKTVEDAYYAWREKEYTTEGGLSIFSHLFDFDRDKRWREEAHEFGVKYIEAIAQGMRDGAYSPESQRIIDEAQEKLGEGFEAHSPPRTGPLHEIDKWGKNLLKTFGGGMVEGVPEVVRNLNFAIRSVVEKGNAYSYATNDNRQRVVQLTQNIYHADEDRIARKVFEMMEDTFGA